MQPIRKVQTATHFRWVEAPSRQDPSQTAKYLTPCSPGSPGALEMTWIDIEPDQLLEPDLTVKDFLKAVQSSRPTVNKADIKQQVDFTNDFGKCIYFEEKEWQLNNEVNQVKKVRMLRQQIVICLYFKENKHA